MFKIKYLPNKRMFHNKWISDGTETYLLLFNEESNTYELYNRKNEVKKSYEHRMEFSTITNGIEKYNWKISDPFSNLKENEQENQ